MLKFQNQKYDLEIESFDFFMSKKLEILAYARTINRNEYH